jgi:hypothetical protein
MLQEVQQKESYIVAGYCVHHTKKDAEHAEPGSMTHPTPQIFSTRVNRAFAKRAKPKTHNANHKHTIEM